MQSEVGGAAVSRWPTMLAKSAAFWQETLVRQARECRISNLVVVVPSCCSLLLFLVVVICSCLCYRATSNCNAKCKLAQSTQKNGKGKETVSHIEFGLTS